MGLFGDLLEKMGLEEESREGVSMDIVEQIGGSEEKLNKILEIVTAYKKAAFSCAEKAAKEDKQGFVDGVLFITQMLEAEIRDVINQK